MLSLMLAVSKQSSMLGQAFPRCCRFFLHLQLSPGEWEPALLRGYPARQTDGTATIPVVPLLDLSTLGKSRLWSCRVNKYCTYRVLHAMSLQ